MIPEKARKSKLAPAELIQPNRNNTSTKGFKNAQGDFVVVPRALRKSIASMFDTANKASTSPKELRDILNYALDTAIVQGAQQARLHDEEEMKNTVAFYEDDSEIGRASCRERV